MGHLHKISDSKNQFYWKQIDYLRMGAGEALVTSGRKGLLLDRLKTLGSNEYLHILRSSQIDA